jgi:hypothetical protein
MRTRRRWPAPEHAPRASRRTSGGNGVHTAAGDDGAGVRPLVAPMTGEVLRVRAGGIGRTGMTTAGLDGGTTGRRHDEHGGGGAGPADGGGGGPTATRHAGGLTNRILVARGGGGPWLCSQPAPSSSSSPAARRQAAATIA